MKNISTIIVTGIVLSITLSQFLAIDSTDKHPYIDSRYVCKDFSKDLIFNASAYHLYLDYIYLPENNHMMVGMYNPLTETITIIEPQNDQIIETIKEDDERYIRINVWYKRQYWYNIGKVK